MQSPNRKALLSETRRNCRLPYPKPNNLSLQNQIQRKNSSHQLTKLKTPKSQTKQKLNPNNNKLPTPLLSLQNPTIPHQKNLDNNNTKDNQTENGTVNPTKKKETQVTKRRRRSTLRPPHKKRKKIKKQFQEYYLRNQTNLTREHLEF